MTRLLLWLLPAGAGWVLAAVATQNGGPGPIQAMLATLLVLVAVTIPVAYEEERVSARRAARSRRMVADYP